MKAKLFDKNGKEKGTVDLPKNFTVKIREDILSKVFEAHRGLHAQAYGAMEGAGAQYSASGISKKKRHDWKATYGKGISRVPRKVMSRHGASFNWIGATISNTRGGRRPHAPRSAKILFGKINKKEVLLAFNSALAGTAKDAVVFDSAVLEVKTKDFILVLKKVFGEAKVWKVKSIRAGRGKMRGRKYKSNAGLLFVVGDEESMKRKGIEVVGVNDLTIRDLTNNGVVGRLVAYTKSAVEELGNRFQTASLPDRFAPRLASPSRTLRSQNVGGKK